MLARVDLTRDNRALARALLAGRYQFAGVIPESPARADGRPMSPWALSPPNQEWLAEAHAFEWLGALWAAGTVGRRRAQALLYGWLRRKAGAHPKVAWSDAVAARRVLAWLDNADLFGLDEHDDLQSAWTRSMEAHVRFCRRRRNKSGLSSALCAAAAARGAHYLGSSDAGADCASAADILDHLTRTTDGLPERRVDSALALISIAKRLRADAAETDRSIETIEDAVARMTAAIERLRHRDRTFTILQGSFDLDPKAADRIIDAPRAERRHAAAGAGYRRLAAKGSVCLVDVDGEGPCAAPLAFEFSTVHGRLVAGCGAPDATDPTWRDALRRTPAWSTLILDGACPEPRRHIRRRHDRMSADRLQESEDGSLLEASHAGYARAYGMAHARRLFLSEGGEELRGEDSLIAARQRGPALRQAVPYAIRFHLHPLVRANVSRDGRSVVLAAPRGAGWRFRAEGARLSVEPSVFAGGGRVRRSRQIVLDGSIPAGEEGPVYARVKWAFRSLHA